MIAVVVFLLNTWSAPEPLAGIKRKGDWRWIQKIHIYIYIYIAITKGRVNYRLSKSNLSENNYMSDDEQYANAIFSIGI